MTCFSATQNPSGVYASSRSCSTDKTSATFFPAKSSANAPTLFPITKAEIVLEVAFAICCAATSVSKLVLFHFPCRSSVMTKIFIASILGDSQNPHPGRGELQQKGAQRFGRDRRQIAGAISENACFKFQFLDQLRGYFLRRTGEEFCLLRLRRDVNLFDLLCRLVRHSQRLTCYGRNLLFLGRHDALQRGIADLVDTGLDRKHGRQRAFHVLKPAGFEFP